MGKAPRRFSTRYRLSGQRVYPRSRSLHHRSIKPNRGFLRRISRISFSSASVCYLGCECGRPERLAGDSIVRRTLTARSRWLSVGGYISVTLALRHISSRSTLGIAVLHILCYSCHEGFALPFGLCCSFQTHNNRFVRILHPFSSRCPICIVGLHSSCGIKRLSVVSRALHMLYSAQVLCDPERLGDRRAAATRLPLTGMGRRGRFRRI